MVEMLWTADLAPAQDHHSSLSRRNDRGWDWVVITWTIINSPEVTVDPNLDSGALVCLILRRADL
jgi:hypothetical protein